MRLRAMTRPPAARVEGEPMGYGRIPMPGDPQRLATIPPVGMPPAGMPPAGMPPAGNATPLGSRYFLEYPIGQGASGRVWYARRRADHTAVAIKVLRPEYAADPDLVTRFLRERTTLQGLDHPHLVQVHDLVVEGDTLAVVMELVEGSDLRRIAQREGLEVDGVLIVLA